MRWQNLCRVPWWQAWRQTNPAWNQAWLEFAERYIWTPEEWTAHGLTPPKPGAYPVWHVRLTAFAAAQKHDPAMAKRAWSELCLQADDPGNLPAVPEPYSGPVALNPGHQMDWGAINHMSQWSLNAIEVLEFAGDSVPQNMPAESSE